MKIVNSEAAAIREAATLVLNGTPLLQIARGWVERGLISSHTGKEGERRGWTANGVKNVLLNPRYVGRRVYNGEDVAEGKWAPILDLDTHLALHEMLNHPSRKQGTSVGRAPQTLLTGIAVCDRCGSPLGATKSRGRESYKCKRNFCMTVPRAMVDEWVGSWIMEMASDPDILTRLNPQGSDEVEKAKADLATARERLNRLAVSFTSGVIDAGQMEAGTADLREQLQAAETVLAQNGRARALGDLLGDEDVERTWAEMPLARARAVIEALVEVRVKSVGRQQRPVIWDPAELVVITERQDAQEAA